MKNTGKKTENWAVVPKAQCVLCGSEKVKTRNETKFFNYGTLENPTELQAEVPVYKCAECDFTYTNRESDEFCHAAVCEHLEVLTPAEVRALRKNSGLTLKAFSKFTGIGQASISRWENSALIQNKAMDSYLRLLDTSQHNLQAIQERTDKADITEINIADKFPQIEQVQTARESCQIFVLRQTSRKTAVQKNAKHVRGHRTLTPEEVRSIRMNLHRTIREFSKVTGIGAASLCRWEQGTLVQNRAMDNYLFLLSLPGNFKFLLNRFRKKLSDDIEEGGGNVVTLFSEIENLERANLESELFTLQAA